MQKNISSYLLFVLITVLVISLYFGNFSGLQKVQWKIDDLLYAVSGKETVEPKIVQVNIDDASIQALGDWPWSYELLADLIATCNSGDPQTILVNLELQARVSEDTTGNTQILADQASWVNNLVLTYDVALADYATKRMYKPEHLYFSSIQSVSDLGILDSESAINIRKPFLPSGIISQYAEGMGFALTQYDLDRKVRWSPLVANYDGYIYPSAPLLAAAVHLGFKPEDITVRDGESISFGAYNIKIDEAGRSFINFNDSGSTFVELSAADILAEQVDPSHLKGNLIIIGLSATGISETYSTPVSNEMNRSELYANVIENIINGNYITRLDFSAGINLLILIGFGAFCAVTLPRVSLLYRMIILIFCLFILSNLNFILFSSYSLLFRPLYLSLEIVLFIIASPLLEEFRFGRGLDIKATFAAKETSIDNLPAKEIPAVVAEPRTPAVERAAAPPEEVYQETNLVTTGEEPEEEVEHEDTVAQDYSAEAQNAIESPPAPPRTISPSKTLDSNAPVSPADLAEESGVISNKSPQIGSGSLSESDKITHLGRYQIVEVLGRGAMGTVYRGIDPAINRDVALKTIRLDFVSDQNEMAELRDRLFREAQAAGNLSHPNIVTIYDVGSEDNLQYIAMECLDGQPLEDMIKKQAQFSYKIIAGIIGQICSALDYAHGKGIVHRDIKPANIMILPDYTVKVMDFGIARIDTSSMTKTGIAMGTPNYIAPELLQGKKVDRRCDIYSLGVVIYELLTGHRPFKGENLTSLIYSIVNEEPKAPSKVNANVPLLFDHLAAKALHKNPAERYQKASDISSALSDFVRSFGSSSKVGI
ncbi:MAG: CHASE2 domain-containing protein [FCB group bacterium]|nr:CHASE2 domain-containing protein [FCB group bacterium]